MNECVLVYIKYFLAGPTHIVIITHRYTRLFSRKRWRKAVFWFVFWPHALETCKGHILLMINHCFKYRDCQSLETNRYRDDNTWSTDEPTDKQMENNNPHLFQRKKRNIWEIWLMVINKVVSHKVNLKQMFN